MPAFLPVTAYRAQIDLSPVVNGQLIIAIDTGEIFLDFNSRRIPLLQGNGGSVSEVSFDTQYATVNAALQRSSSLCGGGTGQGLKNAPIVTIPESETDSITDYPIV